MSPRGDSLQGRVAAAARLVRRRAQLSFGLTAAGVIALVLLSGWLLGMRWPRPTMLALAIDLFLFAGAFGAVAYWRVVLGRRLGRAAVASAAERRMGLDWGSLRGVLELDDQVPAGTSTALARRAEQSLQEQTRGQSASDLAGELGERWRGRAHGAGLVAGAAAISLAILAFRAPDRTAAGWAPLLHPVRQMSPAPLPALVVTPGAAQVARGAALSVRVGATGREVVTLKWRLQGDVVHEQLLAVRNDSAAGRTGTITAAGSYWVEAPDGAESPHYPITPVDALLVGDLSVDVSYPAYLGRPADRYQGDVPPLELPAGSTLRISGRSTRPLSAASLRSGQRTVALAVSGRDFQGSWMPERSGEYAWSLRDAEGAGPAVAPAPLQISVIADRAPTVVLTFPGIDTVLPADLRQPLTADAEDDHAVVAATLVSWRVRAGGGQDPSLDTPLDLGGSAERVQLSTILDASGRTLAPGDTLKYFVRVIDASPGGQSGVSGTYALRVPGADELRARAIADARDVLARTTALQERAAVLQRETRNTDRNAQAANARRGSRGNGSGEDPGSQSSQLRFEETDAARRVLAEQLEVLDQAAQLRADMSEVRQNMAAAGLRDEDLARRMEEVEKLLDRLATPELRQELKALQEALQQLDPAELQQVLERLAREQQDMKEQLDRAVALLREAEAAQALAALSQEARELATQQRALARAHEQPGAAGDATVAATRQKELAARGDSLAQHLEQVARQLRAQTRTGAAEQADSAAGRVAVAQDSMAQAARNAVARQGERAAQEGRAAADQLEQAAESLDAARREAASERSQEATETLQQATRDALALAQQQQALQEEMEHARQGQSESESGDSQESRPQPENRPGSQGQSGKQNGRQPAQQQGAQQGGQQPEQGGGQQAGDQRGGGQGGKQAGGKAGQPGSGGLSQLREEQRAIQQGLEQLGRNLSEAGQEAGTVSRETSAALNRANTSMQETQQALAQAERAEQLPAEQAAQTVEALNRLALSLLQNAQQAGTDGASALQQARQQLADAAQQQGSINGQGNSLLALNLSPGAEGDQVRRLGSEQQALADRLAGMNDVLGGREDASGQVDLLAREAQALAQQLAGGRLTPEVAARQQRLFHKLLDAGRLLEQEETSDERTAERPGNVPSGTPAVVSDKVLRAGPRYRAPTPEELRLLPAGYRQLILDYFERLNRPLPPSPEAGR